MTISRISRQSVKAIAAGTVAFALSAGMTFADNADVKKHIPALAALAKAERPLMVIGSQALAAGVELAALIVDVAALGGEQLDLLLDLR